MNRIAIGAACCAVVAAFGALDALAQRTDAFVEPRDHPAIAYTTAPVHDAVTALNEKLEAGTVRLTVDRESGYLRSALQALSVPAESQSLVFSQTSAQASHISPANPRAIYFNDTTAVGWVRGAEALEVAVQDPRQGVLFYTLDQSPAAKPQFKREQGCLLCHLSWETLGVPGMMVLSTFQMADDPNAYASGIVVDHRSPASDRWGGWYVTGTPGSARHRGNVPVIVPADVLKKGPGPTPQLDSIAGRFDTRGYPNTCSDAVALMVLAHQTRIMNLITRVGWEARVALHGSPASSGTLARGSGLPDRLPERVEEAVRDLVDYMLFVDEAPIARSVTGNCGFAEQFSARGPRDRKGRSLYQLDLGQRLLRYPCSYMINTPAFDALPAAAKDVIYRQMWGILSGKESGPAYAHLSQGDREAIVEILRDTRTDLPDYFGRGVQ